MTEAYRLYKEAERMLDGMKDVEAEFAANPSRISRKRLARTAERLSIVGEVIQGIISTR